VTFRISRETGTPFHHAFRRRRLILCDQRGGRGQRARSDEARADDPDEAHHRSLGAAPVRDHDRPVLAGEVPPGDPLQVGRRHLGDPVASVLMRPGSLKVSAFSASWIAQDSELRDSPPSPRDVAPCRPPNRRSDRS
jgi:hypothetical protein